MVVKELFFQIKFFCKTKIKKIFVLLLVTVTLFLIAPPSLQAVVSDITIWTKLNNDIPGTCDSDGSPCPNGDGRLGVGTDGKGDDGGILYPSIIKDGDTYKMWYTGTDGAVQRIYYATSSDGLTWTKYDNTIPENSNTTSTNGRIPLGISGKGDSGHTYGPSVIKDGDTYKMWYIGFYNGNARVYYATSPDGLTWTKYNNAVSANSDTSSTDGRIPLGSYGKGDDVHAYAPHVIKDGSIYKMWYSGHDHSKVRIYYATSPDGLTWTKYNNTIPSDSDTSSSDGRIPRGTSGKADENDVYFAEIIKDDDTFRMWYAASGGGGIRVLYATSPDGLTWTKYNNTIPNNSDTSSTDGRIPFGSPSKGDSGATHSPAVVKDGNFFKMWYVGSGNFWRIYYATTFYDSSSPSIFLTPLLPDPTNDNTQNIGGTVTDDLGTVNSVDYQIDSTSGSWSSCTSDDGAFDETQETFTCTVFQALTDGSHTIYIRATDSNTNTTASGSEPSDSFTVDVTAPTGSLTINTGDTYTTVLADTLTMSATDATSGVYQMMISENSDFTSAVWESYAATKAWIFTTGDGTKTAYVKFKDNAENVSEVYSDTIIYDSNPPSDEISINSNATYAKTRDVTLTIDATDVLSGIYQMMISETADLSDGTWETYVVTKSWTFSTGDGTKTIYLKFKDLAGNISSIFHDSIILDSTQPALVLLKLNGKDFTSDITTWEVTATKPPFFGTTDPNATVKIYLDNILIGTTTADANGNWSWTPTTDLSLGTYTVTISSTDLAGNTKSLSFTLEVKGPATALPNTGIPLTIIMLTILFLIFSGAGTKLIVRLRNLLSGYQAKR